MYPNLMGVVGSSLSRYARERPDVVGDLAEVVVLENQSPTGRIAYAEYVPNHSCPGAGLEVMIPSALGGLL